MKSTWLMFGLTACLLGAITAWAKPPVYQWVEDRSASSDQVLKAAQASRVISLPEAEALKTIRRIMTDDLFLVLGEYRATRHCQDAETVRDTVLPENVAGQQEVELVDETYRFVLEVSLKAYGDRTRVLATAFPLYRLNANAEGVQDAGGNDAVEVKIKAPAGSAVSLGNVYIEPAPGQPADDQIQPLPDAADRAQKLVRSFLYLLDRRLSGAAGR